MGSADEILGVDGETDEEVMDALSEGGSVDKEDGDEPEIVEQTHEAPPQADEARLPRALRRPKEPSQREKEEHRVLHLPYRNWCRACLYGKGNHDPHRVGQEQDKLDKDVPMVSVDYTFMGDGVVTAEKNPMLCTYDNATDSLHLYVTREKGVNRWIAKAISSDLESMGYGGVRICMKSDQENAVVSVKQAVAELRSSPTSMLESPARESQSNGKMEKAVQRLQGQLRTLKFALEENIGAKVSVRSKAFEWLSLWTATSINRYHVGEDGKTAFARTTGTQCKRGVAEFGEQVHWKISSKLHADKAESLWSEGTFLGLKERTGEVFIADKKGHVIKCRTIRSRPSSER